ncbi:hypothetical protein [Streptomyces sp. CB00455]|uniref:hypothetical protein n=1 Tax=Streptomyces sp. CB00455 TaxID=1703927 RepID=UPI001F5BC014|nr:hypothetical protein [Streptomyces sp. CB00455]
MSNPAVHRRWPTKQGLIIAAAETRIGVLSVPDPGDFRAELRFVLTARLKASPAARLRPADRGPHRGGGRDGRGRGPVRAVHGADHVRDEEHPRTGHRPR